jgi:hypothetical protein
MNIVCALDKENGRALHQENGVFYRANSLFQLMSEIVEKDSPPRVKCLYMLPQKKPQEQQEQNPPPPPKLKQTPEPVFIYVYEAQEAIPRNEFRQPM